MAKLGKNSDLNLSDLRATEDGRLIVDNKSLNPAVGELKFFNKKAEAFIFTVVSLMEIRDDNDLKT